MDRSSSHHSQRLAEEIKRQEAAILIELAAILDERVGDDKVITPHRYRPRNLPAAAGSQVTRGRMMAGE